MAGIPFYKLVFSSVTLLMSKYFHRYEQMDRDKFFPDYPQNYFLPQTKEYDFIVVGSGSAGSVVANHLSKEFSVLLLEVGGDPLPQNSVPAAYGYFKKFEPTLHRFYSVRQTNSALLYGGIAETQQGKFFGGSSVLNGMMYNRGNPKDYDLWAEMSGDESWNYTNLLPYFQRTEGFYEEENPDGHLGVDGPLSIGHGGKELKPFYNAFLRSGKEMGYSCFKNANGPQTEGFGPISETISFGRRCSAYDAFLKPVQYSSPLTASRYSNVSHVDIDDNGRAIGVYYTRHGVEMYAKAKKEIILSAGALNSPVILMRSGVGPADQLAAAGISVKAELPVGQNFQDHPSTRIKAKFDDPSKFPLQNFSQKDVDDFLYKGKGPLTLAEGFTAQAFLVSSVAKSEGELDWPDIEFVFRFDSELYSIKGENVIYMIAILGRVSSRGSISLDPSNPKGQGIWDPRWLEEKRDLKVLAEAAKISAKVFDSKYFKNLGVSLDKTVMKGCENETFRSDKYWECYVRYFTVTAWHPIGTCKMGKDDDPTAVVDTKLKVKGIKGLRVIDNSIQPKITNANTNAPAFVIGQKGADMILREHRAPSSVCLF